MGQSIFECVVLTGTWSAEGIMASGHVNRTNRPNTWLHRPATRREDSPCQLGGRGRDGDFSPPPAQIPAGAANAPGSHLGW